MVEGHFGEKGMEFSNTGVVNAGVGVGWLGGSCQGIVVLQLMKCWSERIVALFGMALPLSLVRCGGRKGAQCILSVSE